MGGIGLSGHMDVVPVTGQPWDTDPFTLVEKGSRLYARGSADMKGYLACMLAAVPDFKRRKLIANQVIEQELSDGSLMISTTVGHANQILPIVRYWRLRKALAPSRIVPATSCIDAVPLSRRRTS